MKQLFYYPFLLILFVFFIIISVTGLVKKDTKFSELEKRYLTEKPKLQWKSILDSSFSSEYETYVNEQFPFRDSFINLKALSETLIGKKENNNIIRGKEGYLFQKSFPEESLMQKNLLTIKQFGENIKKPIYFSIIPNSSSILEDKLPKGAPVVDQKKVIEQNYKLFSNSAITYLNLWPLLEAHQNEYLYYKTDHHWTSLGAYYAYVGFCKQENLTPIELDSVSAAEISQFYGTYYAKYKGLFLKPDTITYYDFPISSMQIGKKTKSSLYDLSKIQTYDKYALFLYGNNALSIIHSKNDYAKKKKQKILLIKDSYANSLIPFLTSHYSEIYIVDLRFYNDSINDLIKEKQINTIWILYNYDTLASDNHLYRLTQPSIRKEN